MFYRTERARCGLAEVRAEEPGPSSPRDYRANLGNEVAGEASLSTTLELGGAAIRD